MIGTHDREGGAAAAAVVECAESPFDGPESGKDPHLDESLRRIDPGSPLACCRILPLRVIGRALRHLAWQRVAGPALHGPPLRENFPWCSPDVWERIRLHYQSRPTPVVAEYGMGISTLWYVRDMLRGGGGRLISLEHEVIWLFRVLRALLQEAAEKGLRVDAGWLPSGRGGDVRLMIAPASGAGCDVTLRWRSKARVPAEAGRESSDYTAYVTALQESCDVIVIDGRARKQCANHVLDTRRLRPGGMLVLLDAGRGSPGWLGMPDRQGKADYQPEVERMLALGGNLIDGAGMDRWPGLARPRTVGPHGGSYPQEACVLIQ